METMTAEDAMREIWTELRCDCGPKNYGAMLEEIGKMNLYLHKISPPAPGDLPPSLRD
jgi:hypothetical protein